VSDAIEKYVTHIKVSVLQEEIRTLRAELDTVKKERDEARKAAELWRDVVNPRAPLCLKSWGVLPWEDDR